MRKGVKKHQTIFLCREGISNINMENIYDISKKTMLLSI